MEKGELVYNRHSKGRGFLGRKKGDKKTLVEVCRNVRSSPEAIRKPIP